MSPRHGARRGDRSMIVGVGVGSVAVTDRRDRSRTASNARAKRPLSDVPSRVAPIKRFPTSSGGPIAPAREARSRYMSRQAPVFCHGGGLGPAGRARCRRSAPGRGPLHWVDSAPRRCRSSRRDLGQKHALGKRRRRGFGGRSARSHCRRAARHGTRCCRAGGEERAAIHVVAHRRRAAIRRGSHSSGGLREVGGWIALRSHVTRSMP